MICRIALQSAVYHIWQQRNAVIHQGKISSEEGIERMIRCEVNSRVKTSRSYCNSIFMLNRTVCCIWGISFLCT